MLKFIANIIDAQTNAKRLTAVENEARALRDKFRNVVSHATGGATADIARSINDICVDISRARNAVFAHGRLADMTTVERNVLDILHDDLITPIAQIAVDISAAEADVRTVLRSFAHKGLVHLNFGLSDGGEGTELRGRGYCLTATGLDLQAQVRAA